MGKAQTPRIEPNPLTDPIIPALRSITLVTAVRLGIIQAVAEGHGTSGEIAEATGLDPPGVERIADALVACGYLAAPEGRYDLTDVSRETLIPGGSMELLNWVRFSDLQLAGAGQLSRVVRTGSPVDLFELMDSDEDRLTHQRAMAETARPIADWIADAVAVPPGASRMVDIGGSHGVYSAAVCRRHPPMTSTVFELPHMVDLARMVAAEEGTDRFCSHVGADFMKATIDSSYDLVFLGNLIHHFDKAAARGLLAKIHHALVDGGVVAIWDVEQRRTTENPTAALFSLLFYVTSGAACYTGGDIQELLETAGFGEFRQIPAPMGGTHCLYTARKYARASRPAPA